MIAEVLSEAEDKMTKAVAAAKEEFATIRTGRATPALFSKILVDYYGTPTPINQLASFQTPEARLILITPFDKAALGDIENAVRNSDLGVNPSNDGNVIRVALPALTEERRKDYVKLARGKAEDSRVSIRNIRRNAKEALNKLAEIGEDEIKRSEKQLDDLTQKYIANIDEILQNKEAELTEV